MTKEQAPAATGGQLRCIAISPGPSKEFVPVTHHSHSCCYFGESRWLTLIYRGVIVAR